MPTKLQPFRREHTGAAPADRMQRSAQQAAQQINKLAGRYVGVGFGTAVIIANVTTASASFADLTGLSASLAAQVGDVLLVDFAHTISASAGFGRTRIAVVDGGNTYASAGVTGDTLGTYGFVTGASAASSNLSGIWVVRKTGTVTVKIQGLCTGGGTLTLYSDATTGSALVRVQQLRAVT